MYYYILLDRKIVGSELGAFVVEDWEGDGQKLLHISNGVEDGLLSQLWVEGVEVT
jgi:hypothetical protein